MDKVFVGGRVGDLDTSSPPIQISRVTLRVDGETTYTAGDDTGRTLEKSCPWGTQAMCEGILASVRGIGYRPFSGVDGLLDPAAEVGDGITIGDVYSVLAKTDITFDRLYTVDPSAPGGDEVEDEYPYKSRASRLASIQQSQIYSRIIKTAEMIRLEVVDEVNKLNARITIEVDRITSEVNDVNNGLSSKIEQTASSLTAQINDTASGLNSKIEQTASSLTAQISATDGRVTSLTQTVDGISTRVRDAEGNVSTLQQTANSLQSQITSTNSAVSSISQKVDNIRLSVSNGNTSSYFELRSGSAVLSSGTITFNGVVTFSDLRGNQTIINGDVIDTGTLYLDSLYGNNIYINDYNRRVAAVLMATGAASIAGQALEIRTGAMRLVAMGGDLYLYAGQYVTLSASSGVTCQSNFYPSSNGSYSCGTSYFRWSDIYATNDTIQTSDREKKTDIRYGLEDYEALFDQLRPVSYKLTDGQSGRTHLGMISQDVEEALETCGISSQDFAGFVKTPRKGEEEGYDYSLRYGEFIALCIHKIQKQEARIAALERRLLS